MKTTLCFTLTLCTFIMLAFVPHSFAQADSPEYVVRVIYFYPNDIEPHPDIDATLDYFIKDYQEFFADKMEFHGFGRKTFRFEANENGDVLVHQVKGNFNDIHYSGQTYGKVIDEFKSRFGNSKNIDFFVVDTRNPLGADSSGYDPSRNHACGIGWGTANRGYAVVPAYGIGCFGAQNYGTEADIHSLIRGFGLHELLHAFGMTHDDTEYDPLEITSCAAEWLDGHRYFNPSQNTPVNHNTTIRMFSPTLVPSSTTVRLRFEITDPDGLHQAQLIRAGDPIIACKKLSGTSATIEFVTTKLFSVSAIHLKVMDAHGSFTWTGESFPIDLTNLLPSPEAISIPDQLLKNAIHNRLNLAPHETITQLNILNLRHLQVSDIRDIKDLTGLEYASNLSQVWIDTRQVQDITPITKLKNLYRLSIDCTQAQIPPITELKNLGALSLGGAQIRDLTPLTELKNLHTLTFAWNRSIQDITPLTQLKNLTELNIMGNPIADFTPLKEMTQLRDLNLNSTGLKNLQSLTTLTKLYYLTLWNNQISDLTPLAELTNLRVLRLSGNQISDVSPLTGLVNLRELYLDRNPLKNRRPLLELLQKNPDVKIYLENDREPLPVNLSHFRAELTDTGVTLKWITESEVDNAGFYIYRSETREGDFKVINPTLIQGAGTTSERNAYTWTDTTAKPNVAYYYRIEDISHAGVREQLATVRLRGLVSARGKLTTIWADLKAEN